MEIQGGTVIVVGACNFGGWDFGGWDSGGWDSVVHWDFGGRRPLRGILVAPLRRAASRAASRAHCPAMMSYELMTELN